MSKTCKLLLKLLFVLCVVIVCAITKNFLALKFYPVVLCFAFFVVFFGSLCNSNKNSIIFKFATLQDKTIKGSTQEVLVKNYCKKVCLVWCAFFVCNGAVAFWTVVSPGYKLWAIYNTGVSYCIMGLIFLVEFIIRKIVKKNMKEFFSISKFTFDCHKKDMILCFEGKFTAGVYKTWGDFLEDSAKVRAFIATKPFIKWILHSEDRYYFLVCYVALLQCQKEILLTANTTKGYIAQLKDENTGFLTDLSLESSHFDIKTILQDHTLLNLNTKDIPAINADETKIHIFTSGSTGQPKDVLQRLKEFEMDNAFVLSMWLDQILKRKFVSTVSCHHIYGLLFSVMLPFTAGVPFGRKRLEYPEEFESLGDTSYMIIAVPAFLKRAVETQEKLPLKSPFIFTSGGVLPFDVAQKTKKVFGFWPLEVYGSTETSGIAYRISKDGPEWTLFANAQIHKNLEGCLVIKSPYIKDKNGFATCDLVDILSDGRFLLKGRADTIVKIEEKRISLPEVENAILKTGLIKEVCVVPLQNQKRQYLAAALVFNLQGKKQFENATKFEEDKFFREYLLDFFEPVVIPKRFRYLESLPTDPQGKKKRGDIQALFTDATNI